MLYTDPTEISSRDYSVGSNLILNDIVNNMPAGKCLLRKNLIAEIINSRIAAFERAIRKEAMDHNTDLPDKISRSVLESMSGYKKFRRSCESTASRIIGELLAKPDFEPVYQEGAKKQMVIAIKRKGKEEE